MTWSSRPQTEETGLGIYWHGVQYLLAGRAQGVRGPLAWFTTGGENVSRTPAGPARYLSPEQVREWAAALAEEPPDELGDGVYDPPAMDRDGVYSGTWVRDAKNTDPLGTMRELYSYLREFVIRQGKARKARPKRSRAVPPLNSTPHCASAARGSKRSSARPSPPRRRSPPPPRSGSSGA